MIFINKERARKRWKWRVNFVIDLFLYVLKAEIDVYEKLFNVVLKSVTRYT